MLKPHVRFDMAWIAGGGQVSDYGFVKAHVSTLSWVDFKRRDFDVAVLGAVHILHAG
jgi:hypothetical protein